MKSVSQEPWLTREEQLDVVSAMLNFGILKISNVRDLPLKSGGMTDIYINLRDARSNPKAIKFFAEVFENPIRRLRTQRLVEIPDAVSCLAGPLAIATRLPMVTIREEAKAGRVTKGKLIGTMVPGERTAIIDDVITDGASKLVPYAECRKNGVDPTLVVLVDRQQGWRQTFHANNIAMPVWAGMTLHQIRHHLIRTLGVMERCSPEVEAKNPIIVALDGKPWEEVLRIVDLLRPSGCILKVNDLLHDPNVTDVVGQLSAYGRVMVDFKGHDIPATVENTCKQYVSRAPWAVTIHGSGGEEMIHRAVTIFKAVSSPTKVLVVTVLTSMDEKTCKEVYTRRPIDQVRALAEIAIRAGAQGFVCSAHEVAMLKEMQPHATLVVPGVRSPGASLDDQMRVDTPAAAMNKGATHLVMGRQILGAKDFVVEVRRVIQDELGIK